MQSPAHNQDTRKDNNHEKVQLYETMVQRDWMTTNKDNNYQIKKEKQMFILLTMYFFSCLILKNLYQ